MAARRFAAKRGLLDAAAVVPYLYTQTLVSVDALAPEAVHPPMAEREAVFGGKTATARRSLIP